jgi:hypothetical protein
LQYLQVTVNYTRLEVKTDHSGPSTQFAVHAIPGLTNNTEDMLSNTKRILVKQGFQSRTVLRAFLRQRFRSSFLATLASYLSVRRLQSTRVHDSIIRCPAQPEVISAAYDSAPVSYENTTMENASYLLLEVSQDESTWRVVRDRRDKDVLGGIARAGGLWTVLNAFCAVIFGSNLLWLSFGWSFF